MAAGALPPVRTGPAVSAPAVTVGRPRVLYRDPRFYSAFPSLAALGDGRLLLAFRRAPDHRHLFAPDQRAEAFDRVDHLHPKSHTALLPLGPDLAPAGPLTTLAPEAETADQDSSLLRLSDGRLVHLSFRWLPVTDAVEALAEPLRPFVRQGETGPAYLHWHAAARTSDDAGASWSAPTPFAPDPLVRADLASWVPGTSSVRGQIVERADGSLLVAAYAFALDGVRGSAVRLFESRDRGRTWAPVGAPLTLADAQLSEASLVAWPRGRISLFARTHGAGGRLAYSVSTDGGQRFTPPRLLDLHGHPAVAQPLPDGRLLLVYGVRTEPHGVRARVLRPGSAPGAVPLADGPEIVLRDDAPGPDTGYPWIAPLAAGRLAVAHYIADDHGIRGIEAQTLRFA
ncbi:hypothetical protein CCR80_05785 [Rhodothalassium salexigens]|nr:hypothetical protein [Rhodothalassium salexigens]